MLALNVAHDMRPGFKRHFVAANGSLYLAVHHNTVSFNTSIDRGLRRNKQRRAVHVALDLTIDLDEALCRHATLNFQAFCNDSSSALEHDAIPHPLATLRCAAILHGERPSKTTYLRPDGSATATEILPSRLCAVISMSPPASMTA